MEIPLKILLLEDSSTDAEIIQRVLRRDKLQFEPKVADNEKAFLQALDQFRPDVILADNSLPQFNASEALKIINGRSLHIPFILVTGTVSEEFAADIMKLGADDYILKDRLNRLPAAIEAAIKQKQYEKEKEEHLRRLAQSEERYRSVMERITDGFIALDSNWRYVYINEKIGQMIRRDPQSLIGKVVWEEFPDAVGSDTYKAFATAMAEQRYMHNVDYYAPLDLWQENHIYPSPDGISVFIRDITEKKRAELALQAARDRLYFHIDNSPLGFIEWDQDLNIKSLSKRAEEIFGWTEQEILDLQKKGVRQIYEDDIGRLSRLSKYMLAGEIQKSNVQHRNYTKDGGFIWCEWFNSILKERDGRITIMSLVQDITERKRAGESLRQSELRLNEAQAIAHISSWEIDLVHNIHYWSDEFFRILGIDKADSLPSAELFLSFIHPDDKDYVAKKMRATFENPGADQMHFCFVRTDGTVRHGYSEWKTERDEKGKPMRLYGILQDITERKRAELELKQTNEQLHSLSGHLQDIREEERIHIAREIHDELGQQLTGLKMDMHWLNKKLNTDDKEVQEKIKSIIGLIDETVKSVRRISSSLRPSMLDDLGLIAALEWHSEEVENRSEIKVNFTTDIQEPELPVAMATGIFRIYQEVLTNAVRHSNAHVITSSLRLQDDCLVLAVKDDGIGMDQSLVKTKKTLGLVGIKERTFLMGGKFDLFSEPGKGTEIRISIPLQARPS
ncbi:MAG TPA: PAS domain S-box protein [Chitinophagaceae bacterium]|nr:PAS domain S-box protein [Chitinophagaceae bacterium]